MFLASFFGGCNLGCIWTEHRLDFLHFHAGKFSYTYCCLGPQFYEPDLVELQYCKNKSYLHNVSLYESFFRSSRLATMKDTCFTHCV